MPCLSGLPFYLQMLRTKCRASSEKCHVSRIIVDVLILRNLKFSDSQFYCCWTSLNFLRYLQCQWRLRHWGSSGIARAFNYDLHCWTRACLLCRFVLPPVSLVKVVNWGSFNWVLSLIIYFRSMSGLSRSCCRWPEEKIPFAVGVLYRS